MENAIIKEIVDRNGKLKMGVIGRDSHAMAIMGRFQSVAKESEWSDKDIKSVLNILMSSNYNSLLKNIAFIEDFSEYEI